MSEMMFDGQREGEEVMFVFRRHILTAKKGIWFMILMTGIGVVPMILWPGDVRMFWVFMVCFGLGVIGALYVMMLWYFSLYIVTNERIRQVSQRGIFRKTVVDLGLDKVQSISMDVPGLRAEIHNYGTILIQTDIGDMTISMVNNPKEVHNKLQDAQKEANG